MPLGDYLAGLAIWALVALCAAGAAALALRGRAPLLRGAPRALAWALVFLAATLGAYLLPGALGLLGRGSVVATAIAILLLAWSGRERARAQAAPPPGPPEPAGGDRLDWGLAGAAVAITAWLVLAALIERAPVAPTNVDALNFHLPGLGAWIHEGGFWQISQWIPDLAHGNYPQNGDLLDLSVVLPWHNDAFVRLVSVPLLGMLGLAVYAIAAEIGAARPAAVLWAAVFASMPAVVQPAALEVLTDTLLLACLGTGILFLLRHHRTDARSDLLLAGIGLGIAFGTKWYGVSSVVVVLAVWAGGTLLAGTPLRMLAGRLATLAGLVAAAGGFWLLRNWVESGNPLFPVKVEVLGLTVFDAPYDRLRDEVGYTVASFLDDPAALADHIVPALAETVALPGLLLGLAAIAAAAIGLRERGTAGFDPRVPALAATSVLLAAAYAVTPYSALGANGEPLFAEFNVRYLVPALLAAAPLAAWLGGRMPGAARRAWGILALVAGAQAAHLTADEIGATPLAQAALAVGAGAALATAARASGIRPRVGTPGRAVLVGGAAAVALACAAAGWELQSRFNDSRYTGIDPVFDLVNRGKVDDARIGLAGVWGVTRESPVWPMFGPRLENEVFYAGEYREGMLRDYRTRAAFLAGVRDAGADYLLVARGEPPRRKVRREAWAASGGLVPVLRSERFTLFRAPPGG